MAITPHGIGWEGWGYVPMEMDGGILYIYPPTPMKSTRRIRKSCKKDKIVILNRTEKLKDLTVAI